MGVYTLYIYEEETARVNPPPHPVLIRPLKSHFSEARAPEQRAFWNFKTNRRRKRRERERERAPQSSRPTGRAGGLWGITALFLPSTFPPPLRPVYCQNSCHHSDAAGSEFLSLSAPDDYYLTKLLFVVDLVWLVLEMSLSSLSCSFTCCHSCCV